MLSWRTSDAQRCSGGRAETRETLTALQRLSSFTRSLMEDSWVTLAPSAPPGRLCTGKGLLDLKVNPKHPDTTQ